MKNYLPVCLRGDTYKGGDPTLHVGWGSRESGSLLAEVLPPSFEDLYQTYVPVVRRILTLRGVRGPDLDDVTQETFLTLHRLLPEFEGRSSIETWLHSVTWRVAANYRRRMRMPVDPSPLVVPADESDHALNADRYRKSLALLDDDKRDLLVLHEIGGWSISSLAELTGRARATIRERIERGRAALARRISGGTPSPERVEWLERMAERFEEINAPPAPFLRVLPGGLTCVSSLGSLLICVWRGPASDDAMQALAEIVFAHARAWPSGIRYHCIIEATSSPPTQEGRAMMSWVMGTLGKSFSAYANTVEGEVLMPIVSSLINACLWLARTSFPVRYFSELEPALAWLGEFGPLDVELTLEHIGQMRTLLAPAPRAWRSGT